MADPIDFSSFSPTEEKAFVPFERVMRDNSKRADTLGFGIAAGVFVIVSLCVQLLYTPCTRFCDRPPVTCDKQSQIDAFKQNCWNACRDMERVSSYTIVREQKDDKSGKSEIKPYTVDGTEFVDNLAACSFAGGAGVTCEGDEAHPGVTKIAEGKGLWCPKK